MRHNRSSNPEDRMNTGLSLYKRGHAEVIVDTNNNLTSVKDANNDTTTYKYDDKGRVYQVISPDTGTTTYSYDTAGNMISKTDAKGVTISYAYDALNRLTNINFPSDTGIVYAYDTCVNGKGRLCSMTDVSGTTVYEYSAKGQVKKETKTIDSVQYITQYIYDQNGNLKTMTYPSGRVITYTLSNDKVTAVLNNAANLATNISYKPFGEFSSLTYGNGLTGSISYDNQYRITGITAGTVMNLSYPTYDANGNITAITNNLDATKNKSFSYDALDRLSTATASGIWGSLTWAYDGVGNRLTEESTVYSYAPGTNKLSGVGGLTYGFDNDGNISGDGTRGYTYNQNQRLIQAVNGSTTASYTYNGNGQRVKKNVNGAVTIFHYSQSGQIIAESNSAGTVAVEYVYLNGQPLAMIANGNTYYYHNDHLGTPQKMTDSTGIVVWSADNKPFGEVNITTNNVTNNLRFPGQYFDEETGLYYNYFRDYNPIIGRYIETDPAGIQRGRNHLFVYVGNNPINFKDLTGLTKSDPWYGYNDRDFQRWFHQCWKEKGGPRITPEEDIAEAYDEWISRGSPKDGKCGDKPKKCEDKCEKQSKLVTAAVVGGYIIYKVIEILVCPPLVPVTP
jgi:RHS repeat-associated protein